MLGRIAIAAMGGCFSQNPDTGAAETTYFPAECVQITGNIQKTIARDAGTTDFVLGFTQTRVWTKQVFVVAAFASYPTFASLGTQSVSSGARTWFFCGLHADGRVLHIVQERYSYPSTKSNPTDVWVVSKEKGSDFSEMTDGIHYSSRETIEQPSLSSRPFLWVVGPSPAKSVTIFYGDLISNDGYGVHWRRIPMKDVEHGSVALFDVDGKQLVEY